MSRRGNGEGTIHQRSDGLWEAQISLGRSGTRRLRRSFYGKTKTEVREKMREALRTVQQTGSLPSETVTVQAFLTQWATTSWERVRPSTARRYQQLIDLHVIPALGSVRLAKLTPQQVQGMLTTAAANGLSPQTVSHVRSVLRTAPNQALRWEMVTRNSAALVSRPRVPNKHRPALDPTEARQVLAAFAGTRLEAVVTIALYGGLRQGEILGLRWSSIDLGAKTMRVDAAMQRVFPPSGPSTMKLVQPKTSKSRRVLTMPDPIVNALRIRRAEQAAERLATGSAWTEAVPDLVFTGVTGTPVSGVEVTRRFQAALRSAALPRRTFHELRHGCATLLLASGTDLKVVSQILGHSTITLTADTYAAVLPVLEREAADRLDQFISRGRGGE